MCCGFGWLRFDDDDKMWELGFDDVGDKMVEIQ